MTRACARTVKPEVNSFRFEFHSDSLESRILLHMETLCTRRYQEQDHEEARTEAQAHKEKKEGEERGKREATKKKGEEGEALSLPGARPGRPRVPGPLLALALATRVPGPAAGSSPACPGARATNPGSPAPPLRPPSPLWVPGPAAPGARATSRAGPARPRVPGRSRPAPAPTPGARARVPWGPAPLRGLRAFWAFFPCIPPSSLISSLNYIRASPSSFRG